MCNTNQIYALANHDSDGAAPTQAISITYVMPSSNWMPLSGQQDLHFEYMFWNLIWHGSWPAAATVAALIIITICTLFV